MNSSFARRVLSAANHICLKMQHRMGVCLPIGEPISAMIEISSRCNLKCPLCPTGCGALGRETGMMDEALFRMIVDQLDDRFTRILIPAMWGESMLHPRFLEFMKYARKKTWRISISTNGNIRGDGSYYRDLVRTGIDDIVCAVDGHDQEAYAMYRRGGKLELVHDFLRSVREARDREGSDRPELVGQIHPLSSNENHIADIRRNTEQWVDRIQTKVTRIFHTEHSDIAAVRGTYKELHPRSKEHQYIPTGRTQCPSMLYAVFMNWKGDVIACCKDPKNVLTFGNIRDASIREIRGSRRFVEMKKKLVKGVFDEEICKRCMSY